MSYAESAINMLFFQEHSIVWRYREVPLHCIYGRIPRLSTKVSYFYTHVCFFTCGCIVFILLSFPVSFPFLLVRLSLLPKNPSAQTIPAEGTVWTLKWCLIFVFLIQRKQYSIIARVHTQGARCWQKVCTSDHFKHRFAENFLCSLQLQKMFLVNPPTVLVVNIFILEIHQGSEGGVESASRAPEHSCCVKFKVPTDTNPTRSHLASEQPRIIFCRGKTTQ